MLFSGELCLTQQPHGLQHTKPPKVVKKVKVLITRKTTFYLWMVMDINYICDYFAIYANISHYVIHLKIALYVSHTSAFLKMKKLKRNKANSLSLSLLTHTHTHTYYCLGAIAETCISKTKLMESQTNTGYCSINKIRIVLRKNLEFDGLVWNHFAIKCTAK